SMLATDEEPSRIAYAVSGARQMITDMSRGDEAMIIAAGPTPKILSSFTGNKAALLDALDGATELAGGGCELDAALRLASSVTSDSGAKAVVFSDGILPPVDPRSFSTPEGEAALNLSYFPVGSSGENAGIVSAGSRRNVFTNDYEIFVAVRNHLPRALETDVTFYAGEQLLDVLEVSVDPGDRSELTLENLPYIGEPIRIELDHEDALDADNTAYIAMAVDEQFKVALCTERESLPLRRVLQSLEFVELYDYASEESERGRQDVDVWVVDGNAPSGHDPAASYLFIDSTSHPFLPVVPGNSVKADFLADPPIVPAIVGVDNASDLMRFVNISNLNISRMRLVQLQPWARTVVEATEGPLIVEGYLSGQRTLYIAMDIYDSDLPVRASFPILMSNAIRGLGSASGATSGLTVAAGNRVQLVAPVGTTLAEVTTPGGEELEFSLETRDLSLADTTETGVYDIRYFNEDGEQIGGLKLPVCLASEDESNIAPYSTLRLADAGTIGTDEGDGEIVGSRQVRVNREFYTWLILLVLLIMGLEWYLFHTRTL
ncbi:MAG TPA: VWA domain-containing protein, partial [Firmicutes bacterium]|nr:VWA domain-containing protein [Bacillota bacterium]